MPRNFNELRAKMSPERRARNEAQAAATLEKMSLHELRKARRKTQVAVAEGMGVGQGEISKIEARGELRLGTLNNYVQALGGHLELRAVFPDISVQLQV